MGNKMNSSKYEARRHSLEEIIKHSHCYKDLKFVWCSSKCGRYIRFIDNKVNAYGPWNISLPSSLIISNDNCIEYEFEIKMHSNSHERGSSLMMGFIYQELITNDSIDYNNNLVNIDNDKQFVFQIGYGKSGLFKFYGKHKVLSDSIQLPYSFNNDDTFKLRINFKQRNIELYYNDRYIGTIFNEIPINIKLIPCVALKNAQISIINSKYIAVK
eukprot:326132_1